MLYAISIITKQQITKKISFSSPYSANITKKSLIKSGKVKISHSQGGTIVLSKKYYRFTKNQGTFH